MEDQYEVESILKAKCVGPEKRKKIEFFTKWKDYSMEDNSWEPISAFSGGAEHFLDTFWERVNHGGRSYRDIKEFKVGEEFEKVGPPKHLEGPKTSPAKKSSIKEEPKPVKRSRAKATGTAAISTEHSSKSDPSQDQAGKRPQTRSSHSKNPSGQVVSPVPESSNSRNVVVKKVVNPVGKRKAPAPSKRSKVGNTTKKNPGRNLIANSKRPKAYISSYGFSPENPGVETYTITQFFGDETSTGAIVAHDQPSASAETHLTPTSSTRHPVTVSSLSAEVLTKIFELVCDDGSTFYAYYGAHTGISPYASLPAWNLTQQICRRWRDIVQNCTKLWSKINICVGACSTRFPPSGQEPSSLLLQYLRNSKEHPLAISIKARGGWPREIPQMERNMIAMLVTVCDRWKTVVVGTDAFDIIPKLGPLPLLESIKFGFGAPCSRSHWGAPMPEGPQRNKFSGVINLRSFSVQDKELDDYHLSNKNHPKVTSVGLGIVNKWTFRALQDSFAPHITHLSIIEPRLGDGMFGPVQLDQLVSLCVGEDASWGGWFGGSVSQDILTNLIVPNLSHFENMGSISFNYRAKNIASMLTKSGANLQSFHIRGEVKNDDLKICLKAMPDLKELVFNEPFRCYKPLAEFQQVCKSLIGHLQGAPIESVYFVPKLERLSIVDSTILIPRILLAMLEKRRKFSSLKKLEIGCSDSEVEKGYKTKFEVKTEEKDELVGRFRKLVEGGLQLVVAGDWSPFMMS